MPTSEELGPQCGLGRQVQLLFRRSLRQVLRDKPTNIGRAMSQLSSAVVFAAIYWRMGRWGWVGKWGRGGGGVGRGWHNGCLQGGACCGEKVAGAYPRW